MVVIFDRARVGDVTEWLNFCDSAGQSASACSTARNSHGFDMPELIYLFIYLLTGALAGLTRGLLGVGGGLIIVPALLVAFTHQGFAPEVLTQMALGTSLATIFFTSLSAVKAHHEHRAVRWQLVRAIAPGLIAGTLAGAVVAHLLQGRTLQLVIGVFALFMGLRMLTGWQLRRQPKEPPPLPGRAGLATGGSIIGVASPIFGIGGGRTTPPRL